MLDEEQRAKLELEMDNIVPCIAEVHEHHGDNTFYIDDDPESLANFCIRQVDQWLCMKVLQEETYLPKEPITDQAVIDRLPAHYRDLATEELRQYKNYVAHNKRNNRRYYLGLKAVVENDSTLAYFVLKSFMYERGEFRVEFSPLATLGQDNREEVDIEFHRDAYEKFKKIFEPDIKQD